MRAGFTLVEMLVALAVFGLLAAAGVAVTGYAVRTQDAVAERSDRLAEFQRLRGLIKADLVQAAVRRTRGADGRSARQTFQGSTSGQPLMALVRRGWENPDGDPRASVQYVEYSLNEGRLERRARAALDGAPLGEPQVLARDVAEARVAWMWRGQWIEAWEQAPPDATPQAVRLTLTIDGLGPVTQLFLAPGGEL
ncbi:type II secretion system minor pseudopilin GspJ [Brevundimonas sp.]|uniref:type II secretion system minor pseudopilin GspJ n=1 Tax=Brevundimonas sp. TaxID=1871086 RepID=UPI0025EBB679|nr:type II secretion system minor pseudopilin GspJ [Brevundimonas sp.]